MISQKVNYNNSFNPISNRLIVIDSFSDILRSDESPKSDLISKQSTNMEEVDVLPRGYWPVSVSRESDLVTDSSNPTVWIGAENGNLFVYSAVSNWNKSLHSVRLPSGVNTIDYLNNRVFVGLSGGSVAVFYRDSKTKLWDLRNYQLLDLGRPAHCVRCSVVAPSSYDASRYSLWIGHRNKIHVIDPISLKLKVTHSCMFFAGQSLSKGICWLDRIP